MQQRVQIFHRRHTPSSAVQLPITATLNAEYLTLFAVIIQHLPAVVNREFYINIFFIDKPFLWGTVMTVPYICEFNPLQN